MIKKKGVIITLALAGVVSVGGAMGLHAGMERNMKEKQVTQIERRQEVSQEINQEDANQAKSEESIGTQEDSIIQNWNDEEVIYLPEGAEIISNDEYGCNIAWDNWNISYMHYSMETKEDLGLGKLKPIIGDAVKKYTGQELGQCDMQIFIEDPLAESFDEQEGQQVQPELDLDLDDAVTTVEENGITIIKTEDGIMEVYEDCVEAESIPDEVRDIYYLESKCYQVHILTDNNRYDIWIDSVTGQVTVFNHEDETLGSFTNGWDIMSESGEECQVSSEEQKEYDEIIDTFVSDELKLGSVEKYYSQDMYVNYTGTTGNNIRAYYNAVCKTDEGAVVEVTFDIGEKKVTSFRTSTIYMPVE